MDILLKHFEDAKVIGQSALIGMVFDDANYRIEDVQQSSTSHPLYPHGLVCA
jgi:hypothetical protein